MRIVPIDASNLGIFLKKQGHSFQFQNKIPEGASPSPLVVCACRYFFMFLSEELLVMPLKCSEYMVLILVKSKIQSVIKEKFCL